jgi:hypothetical protein
VFQRATPGDEREIMGRQAGGDSPNNPSKVEMDGSCSGGGTRGKSDRNETEGAAHAYLSHETEDSKGRICRVIMIRTRIS